MTMAEPRFLISRDEGGTALFEIHRGSLYQLEASANDDDLEQGYYDADMNFLGLEPDTLVDKGDKPGHPFRGNQYAAGHGMTIHQRRGVNNERIYEIREADGSYVAEARLSHTGEYVVDFGVVERHRREGIGSALYDYIEADIGYELKPSPVFQTGAGEAFWTARHARKIGKLWDESKHPRGKTSESSTPGSFAPAGGAAEFIEARGKSTRGGFLSPLDPSGLSGHQLYMNKEGTVGYALDPDNDIQNVFNNGGEKGAGGKALIDAIEKGGRTLDCYDGYLNDLYRQFGFHETGRMRFNDAFAPPGWDFDKHGRPDVVFMSWKGYDGGPEQSLARAKGKRDSWIKNERSTRYGNDWDDHKQRSRDEAKP